MCYDTLGLLHRQMSNLNQAKDCQKRVLDVYLKKLGPKQVKVAAFFDNLGLIYRQQGDLNQGKECHERSLDICLFNFNVLRILSD